MKYSLLSIFGCAALSLLAGCSTTRYALREVPDSVSSSGYFDGGLKFSKRASRNLEAALAFDRMRTGKSPEFRLVVKNLGKTAMDFDPATVRCVASSAGETVHSSNAIDPEKAIALLQKSYDDLEVSGAEVTASALNATSGLLALAAGNDRAYADSSRRQAEDERQDESRRETQGRLREEMKTWRTEMIRKTTLKTGVSIKGALVCPTDSEDYDRIVVTIMDAESNPLAFSFERFAIEN